jgi:hypothetical protein
MYLIKYHAIKTYGGAELWLKICLRSKQVNVVKVLACIQGVFASNLDNGHRLPYANIYAALLSVSWCTPGWYPEMGHILFPPHPFYFTIYQFSYIRRYMVLNY